MHWTTVEIRIEPNMERIGAEALALHIQISEREGSLAAEYRLWKGVLFGPSTSELLKEQAIPLEADVIRKLLESLRSAEITACPIFEVWIHPKEYRLEIQSGFNSAHYGWQEELPEQWKELEPAIDILKGIAQYATGDA